MSPVREPFWCRVLLLLVARGEDAEFILGDLAEDFAAMVRTEGTRRARSWYRRQTLSTAAACLRRRPLSLDEWAREARLAVRRTRREPGYATTTIITLALGIGGALSVAALALAMLRPLPFPHSEQLVAVWETREGIRRSVAPANYLDWRDMSRTFEGLAAHMTRPVSITVAESATRERIAEVSGNYFAVLGIAPTEGRGFSPQYDASSGEREAVLSHEVRVEAFGDIPDVLGRTFLVDDVAYEVVGVLPPAFTHPEAGLFAWLRAPEEVPGALQGPPGLASMRDAWYFEVVGRVAPGVAPAAAAAEMSSIAARLAELHPDTNETSGVTVVPLLDQTVAGFGGVLLALAAAVGLLLVASLFNVAHLSLARAEGRRQDTAVRISLGATGAEIRRSVLVEGLLLGLLGAGLGLVLAARGLDVTAVRLSGAIPRATEIALSPGLIAIAGALGVVAGSAIAAAADVRSRPEGDLRSRMSRRRGGNALIGVQVAVSIAILSGAALLASSFSRLGRVDLGFETANLETLRVSIPDAPARPYPERIATYREVADVVRSIPGVLSVGLGSGPPTGTGPRAGVRIHGGNVEGEPPDAGWQPVDDEYFTALGMTLLRGRPFSTADNRGAQDVAIVNEAFARSVMPNRDALGSQVTMGLDGHDRPLTIIGIVADTRSQGPASPPAPVLYRPVDQTRRFDARSMFLAVRTEPDLPPMGAEIFATVRSGNPGLALDGLNSGRDLLRPFRSSQAILLALMTLFAATAVSIGAVGMYGVGVHSVRRQHRDIGVRMALGATRGRVTREVLFRGLRAALIGVPPGLLLAFAVGRSLDSLLFGISASDPRTALAVATAMLGLTAGAFLVPARLAAAIQPADATRDA